MHKLYNRIKGDIKTNLKEHNKEVVTILKTLIGEIERDPSKNYSDNNVIKCIKKYIKNLEIVKQKSNNDISFEKSVLEQYLPKQLTEQEIVEFLRTIDFSKFKNKFAAIGILKKEFGERVDADIVRKIIEKQF